MNKLSLLNISLVALVFGLNAGNTHAQTTPTSSPDVPNNLQVPQDQNPIFKALAKGSQIYVCKAKADNPNSFEWTLKGPDAVLLNEQGQKIGKHYLGPSWESNDGSKVIGKVKTQADAPQASAIPWLLLQVRSHEGDGIFSQVNWIQRLNTVGGKAPTQGCDRVNANGEVRIAYQADYYFWGGVAKNKGGD
ncbi:DUF3455 domain-containing protein [Fischerella sp. PCC 9605]|uniref:DUF3455 domain-containing protein n=1 Tax=Fischerella sp. PCC 9605 TaxID=1173024 RepID=UPI0004BA8CCC|nr:DUF3455 domain-containing protein [Fischerella sp. PCC 9605]